MLRMTFFQYLTKAAAKINLPNNQPVTLREPEPPGAIECDARSALSAT